MIERIPMHDRRLQIAIGALTMAAMIFVWSLVAALRIEPTSDAAPPQFNIAAAQVESVRAAAIEVAKVVDLNLFAPDRSAPLRRYSLSGYEDEPMTEVAMEVARPVVLGTAVGSGERSFAMCSLEGAPTVIVRVGDKLGDYTVRSIRRGVVEFSSTSGERFAVDANPS